MSLLVWHADIRPPFTEPVSVQLAGFRCPSPRMHLIAACRDDRVLMWSPERSLARLFDPHSGEVLIVLWKG